MWRECVAYARARGALHETLPASPGSETSPRRSWREEPEPSGWRAAGPGTPAGQIPAIIGQASEALDSVPLIAEAVSNARMGCSALRGLAGLIAGELSPGEWMARVRQAERARRAA